MSDPSTERRTARGHRHAEAFNLMWYACRCGHQERYWNSRDGVTPFCTQCPSCDSPSMGSLAHVRFLREDTYAPDHKPNYGQRIWVDMTRQRAEQYVRGRMDRFKAAGHEIAEDQFEALVLDMMGEHGASPDCVIFGVDAP